MVLVVVVMAVATMETEEWHSDGSIGNVTCKNSGSGGGSNLGTMEVGFRGKQWL